MIVYHGSDHIIETPVYHGSKRTNDYGYGFYTTESKELAKEWACGDGRDGFANSYELDMEGLRILNLNGPEYNILNWLAVLTKYRSYWQNGSIAEDAKDYLQANFLVDLSQFDIVIGYRADDSYFSFAQDFVSGVISLNKLSEAMRLGKLGEQIVLKSKFAFSKIKYEGFEPAEKDTYYVLRKARDDDANRTYFSLLEESSDGLFIQDIIRGGITNDDPRIPRNLSE